MKTHILEAGQFIEVRIPLKPRNPFFRAFSQLLKLRFTAMVTYSFHFYSRSLHHFSFLLVNICDTSGQPVSYSTNMSGTPSPSETTYRIFGHTFQMNGNLNPLFSQLKATNDSTTFKYGLLPCGADTRCAYCKT